MNTITRHMDINGRAYLTKIYRDNPVMSKLGIEYTMFDKNTKTISIGHKTTKDYIEKCDKNGIVPNEIDSTGFVSLKSAKAFFHKMKKNYELQNKKIIDLQA